ncbi:hypothetical protein M407DRAFT_241713 [Tulasnella calospora MUT 4182]|uniref:Uncharacterized protein n=1 Tax=Tulasnella calospora MUT 4182 TaxID=1051891 RepID=A0A0C3QI06_9AGAM|nr:hypothetical protein M407DRAFT_241713 [Tulasnella calospora MUT 4182]
MYTPLINFVAPKNGHFLLRSSIRASILIWHPEFSLPWFSTTWVNIGQGLYKDRNRDLS